MKPIIEIKNLSAGYDGRTVLHDVNLSIYERDFLGIIGPNGGGKTTLIKCILGLLKPTGGEIIFHTPEKASTKTTSTLLGYLPQYNSIDRKFPISVEEVILSGLSIQKSLTSRFTPEQKEKGKQIISRMGLEGLEHRSIGQLSGGQLQRALLGRAIISDPAVLILDEPSTYIDKRFEARLYELLAEINKEMCHYPCQSRHRHCIATGKIYRLRQRNAGLPSGYRRYYRMAGKELQLPYRAIGTRHTASSGFRRTSSPSLKISAKDDLHESICAKKFIGRFVQTN